MHTHLGWTKQLATKEGLPRVAVKECIDVAGQVTRCGSLALAGRPSAERNAVVVEWLLAAGFQLAGTAAMHELAFGMTGINQAFGTPVNPQWPDLIPGGSSSGSATLVASGQCELSVGTDTGGSVRLPAACCGVLGLKTTFGLIDRAGVHPEGSTLDSIGFMAQRPEMIMRAVMATIPGPSHDQQDKTVTFRLARCKGLAAPEIEAGIDDFLGIQATSQLLLKHLRDAHDAGLKIIGFETAQAFGHLLESGKIGADVASRLERGLRLTSADMESAEEMRQLFTEEVDAALQDADAILLPTLPAFPPSMKELEQGFDAVGQSQLVRPFNLSGHPAFHIPIQTVSRKPAGFQLVGRRNSDVQLCTIASLLIERSSQTRVRQ